MIKEVKYCAHNIIIAMNKTCGRLECVIAMNIICVRRLKSVIAGCKATKQSPLCCPHFFSGPASKSEIASLTLAMTLAGNDIYSFIVVRATRDNCEHSQEPQCIYR